MSEDTDSQDHAVEADKEQFFREHIYPHKCCRCGYCCLSENCLNAQVFHNIPKKGVICPSLKFDKDMAICTLCGIEPEIFGIGVGCCIKARCIKGKREYDFAGLPKEIKIALARRLRNKIEL